MFTGIVSAHLRTAKILAFILCQFCSRRYAICLKHVAYSCAISMRFHKQYRLVSGSRTWVSQLMLWLSPKKWFWKHWSCGNRRVWHHTVEFWQRHPTQVAASTTDSYCSKLAVGSTQGQAKCGLLTVCWLGKKKASMGKHEMQMSLQQFCMGAYCKVCAYWSLVLKMSRLNVLLTFNDGSTARADVFMSPCFTIMFHAAMDIWDWPAMISLRGKATQLIIRGPVQQGSK